MGLIKNACSNFYDIPCKYYNINVLDMLELSLDIVLSAM